MQDNLTPAGTFYMFAGVALLTTGFVLRFVPETAGHTLEELERLLLHGGPARPREGLKTSLKSEKKAEATAF